MQDLSILIRMSSLKLRTAPLIKTKQCGEKNKHLETKKEVLHYGCNIVAYLNLIDDFILRPAALMSIIQ